MSEKGMEPVVYQEGLLLKRQRGLHSSSTKKLKFQERFCRLTSTSLDYYDPNVKRKQQTEGPPKGQFDIRQVRIVEAMERNMFGKEFSFAFQIGDLTEIMYFVAPSQEDMDEWLRAFRHAASDAGNQLLTHYHHGVFGLINKGRWSCCANTSRACHGCSLVTKQTKEDMTKTLPVLSTPPTRRVMTGSAEVIESPAPKSSSLPRPGDGSGSPNNQRRSPLDPSTPPMIRSFTLTDPLMKPTLKRLRKSGKFKEVDEREEEEEEGTGDKDKPIKIMSRDSDKTDSNKLLSPDLAKSAGQELHNGGIRSGTSSPSPSVDSGRGGSTSNSRPSSQIDHDIVRKPPTSDEGEGSSSPSQSKIEELKEHLDGGSSDGTEEKYRDRGSSTSGRHKIICEETDGPSPVSRKLSSSTNSDDHHQQPPVKILRASASPRRPMSFSPSEVSSTHCADHRISMVSSGGSESSVPHSPFRRRHHGGPGGRGSSQAGDRPRSIFQLNGTGLSPSPLSRLHQACKDGNMNVLEEELRHAKSTDCLDERSLGPLPYTPLFTAFINDHFAIMVSLLEHGANPNTVEPVNKASVLHLASEKGCHDIVDLFIKYKANVNQQDSHGNTPLMAACRNGHLGIAQLLLQSGARVDDEDHMQRTCLHDASELGDVDLVELLLKGGGADPIPRDINDFTPYDVAYGKGNREVMSMLHDVIPEPMRPYSLRDTVTVETYQMITSLTYHGNTKLIAGSRDCNVYIWDTTDLSKDKTTLRFTNTVLDIDIHGENQLLVGSTTVQLIYLDNMDRRRTIADDMGSDESLEDPALHRAKFGPKGHPITASVEASVLKLWPVMTTTSKIATEPDTRILMGQELDESGCIYSISVSPSPNSPWIAVGLQPGKIFTPKENKLVYCLNSETKKVNHIFDAGSGGLGVSVHTTFSADGQQLVIGCAENLCIWEAKTGVLLYKFTIAHGASVTSLCYSPDSAQLAAGLSTGEVQVFEIACSSSIFMLPAPQEASAATAVSYSQDVKSFAVGHRNGLIQIWEAYGFQSNSTA